jgi:hypothetical protein
MLFLSIYSQSELTFWTHLIYTPLSLKRIIWLVPSQLDDPFTADDLS